MPPLGWFYAQGLIPLGSDSSDDDQDPCELPDGRMVCGPHGFAICGKCCIDFTFQDDSSGNEGESECGDDYMRDDEADGRESFLKRFEPAPFASTPPAAHKPAEVIFSLRKTRSLRKGVGRAFPTEFRASEYPFDLFRRQADIGGVRHTGRSGRESGYELRSRYVHRAEPDRALILTDGACLNNGQPNPKAGWAFIHEPGKPGVRDRLEHRGPFGDPSIQSSNRAELRAVIAALRFWEWHVEGFRHLVIATDSEYVVKGSTKWARTWIRNGWQTKGNATVKNKDLWEVLLGEVEQHKEQGLSIEMWHIPREHNTAADMAAKAAAAQDHPTDRWSDVFSLLGDSSCVVNRPA